MSSHEPDAHNLSLDSRAGETSRPGSDGLTQNEPVHGPRGDRKLSASNANHRNKNKKMPVECRERIAILLPKSAQLEPEVSAQGDDHPSLRTQSPPGSSRGNRKGRRRCRSPYPRRVHVSHEGRKTKEDANVFLSGEHQRKQNNRCEDDSGITLEIPVIDSDHLQPLSFPVSPSLSLSSHSTLPTNTFHSDFDSLRVNPSNVGINDETEFLRSMETDSDSDSDADIPRTRRYSRRGANSAFGSMPSATMHVVGDTVVYAMGSYQMIRKTNALTTQRMTGTSTTSSSNDIRNGRDNRHEGKGCCSLGLDCHRYMTEIIRFALFCAAVFLIIRTTGFHVGDYPVREAASLLLLLIFLLRAAFGPGANRGPSPNSHQTAFMRRHMARASPFFESSGYEFASYSFAIGNQFIYPPQYGGPFPWPQ